MSFQQGLSGLNSSARALDVVGNNIANAGTVGFKGARGEFADVYAASLTGAGASQIGVGAVLPNIAQQFTQGNLTTTSNTLDVAINGGGFFRMSNNGAISYTRNGQFSIDKEGYIVNAQGYRLTGYPADYSVDSVGIIVPSTPTELFIDPADLQPKQTGEISIGLNLDSRKDVPPPGHTTFDPADPLSYTASTAVTIYDSLGNPHVLTMYFVKLATPGQWNMYTSLDSVSDNSVPPPSPSPIFSAGNPTTLIFNTAGVLTSPLTPTTFNVSLNNVATNLGKVNNANPTQSFTIDLSTCTQFGSVFGVNKMVQDGFSSGRLAGLSISPDGVIQGRYSNGQSRNMGQIVLAKFNNPNGLMNLGGNQWQETSASGQPLIGAPGTGSNGVVQSGAIEESNVDLTAELVSMITLQRMYQANAQTIKTQDAIMQTLVNLR
ncbi:MAG: flagellar hook protein FlgE [Rhodocyclaceae bacterium]|nr:flagellar hook protein FlgE [Rhodocyclaceae bacterium]